MRPPWSPWRRDTAAPPRDVLDAGGVRSREVMAAAPSGPLWLVATRTRLLLLAAVGDGEQRTVELLRDVDWVDLDLADWEAEQERLTIVPSDATVAPWTVDLAATDAKDLLVVVRERLSSTMVLERHASLDGRRVTAVGRRRTPADPVQWRVRYAEGTDPDDPDVRRAAARLLASAQDEVGG
ncbi:hypothetical protein KLP28_03375 [Nocardioidaceae bacterium]|nr:hypothetical protein KLP28_03375 [Nocardioidaceae bacterium]